MNKIIFWGYIKKSKPETFVFLFYTKGKFLACITVSIPLFSTTFLCSFNQIWRNVGLPICQTQPKDMKEHYILQDISLLMLIPSCQRGLQPIHQRRWSQLEIRYQNHCVLVDFFLQSSHDRGSSWLWPLVLKFLLFKI